MANRLRHSRLIAVVPLLSALTAACSPLDVLNTVVPAGDYDLQADIAYGEHPRQKLDVYKPTNMLPDTPVFMFLYGGSWKKGKRGQYRFIAETFTRRGFVVVIPDYRLYPDVRFPAFVEDAAAATDWTVRNLVSGTKSDLFVAGHSAGAHIASLLATDIRYLATTTRSALCGAIGISGPYSFDPLNYKPTRAIFEHLPDPDIARPFKRISATPPPFLLMHGKRDTTVAPKNTGDMEKALQFAGGKAESVFYDEIGHIKILLAMASPFDSIAPVNDRISEFVERHRACRG